mgnify:CR=1 FL=1
MAILTVKQLDTNKVKDLVYGLENFEKDKTVRAGLYAGVYSATRWSDEAEITHEISLWT